MPTRVGFIGLGAIGAPMAVHVAHAFDTVVWNRTAEKAARFGAEHPADVAPTVSELVARADVVITCLPTSQDVGNVLRSAGDAWRAGQLVVDCTSGDPAGTRRNGEWCAERGVGFVDAPVSGGTSGAEAGTLTVMLGGEPAHVDRARAVVAPFAGTIVHVGPVGTGHALKAVNQALLAANLVAAGEGLAALVRLGVEARRAVEVINASSGRSNVTEHLIPDRVLSGRWPRTFSLALLDKDVRAALEVLAEAGMESEVYRAIAASLHEAHERLDPAADHVEVIRRIEERTGVEIR